MATLMVMLGLSALIGFSSEQALRFLESQRAGSLDTTFVQLEETVLQLMQTAYYEEYRSTASDSSGSKIITSAELDAMIHEAFARLGVSGSSGTTVTIPHSSGNSIELSLQANFPPSITQIDTQASTPYGPIQGTYSWLDGISAIQKSIDITISLSGKNSFSGKIRSSIHTYRLQLLEIPVENISLSALGNLTLPNRAIQAGNGYFAGSIQAGNGVQFQNRLISGDRSNSAATGPTEPEGNKEGWSERGYTEIVTTNTVRNLTTQRAPALGTALKTSYYFREGLASQSGFSTAEKSQLKAFQPYYQVPTAQRLYGVHNPTASEDSLALTLIAGSGEEQNRETIPSWATVRLVTNSTPKVQLVVDLSLVPPDSNQEVNLFIGSRNNSITGPFTQAEVVLLPWENIPSDRKITVISPNSIVITGNFNQGSSPASVHFFANRVYYGSGANSQVQFEGTYSNYQQNEIGSTLNFQASDGSIPTSSSIQMNSSGNTTIHRHHHFYYLVLKSKIP